MDRWSHGPSDDKQRLPLPTRASLTHVRKQHTQQGAAFQNLNSTPPRDSAPPTSKSHRVPPTIFPNSNIHNRLQIPPPTDTARDPAPHRASGRSCPPPSKTRPKSHRSWSCAANTRNPLQAQYFLLFFTPHRPICRPYHLAHNVHGF
jgi:hypothetical protein